MQYEHFATCFMHSLKTLYHLSFLGDSVGLDIFLKGISAGDVERALTNVLSLHVSFTTTLY